MRFMPFVFAAVMSLTACLESEDPKKVELVDNTTKNTDTGKQAVSDEDFAALQEKVKALESKLAALESNAAAKADVTALEGDVSSVQTTVSSHGTSISSLNTSVGTLNTTVSGHGTRLTAAEADIAAHDSELAAMNTTVNALATQENLKQLYLYDGNKVKRHKIVTVYDRSAWQEALVEIENGVNARYYLNRFSDANSSEAPAPLESSAGAFMTLTFSDSGCSGSAYYSDGGGSDYGQAGLIGNYVAWVTASAVRLNGYTYNSNYSSTGTCTNNTVTTVAKASVATLHPKSSYTYPNPLTVGP